MIFTFLVSSLQDGLDGFCGTWLRCSQRLEWNNHFRVVVSYHSKNHPLHPAQLPDLCLKMNSNIGKAYVITEPPENKKPNLVS